MEKIKVLFFEPRKEPKVIEIYNILNEMQNLVGGHIEVYMPFDDDVAIVCNEEGRLLGLPTNRFVYNESGQCLDVICGNFFLCYAPSKSEDFQSMPDTLIEKYTKLFS